MNTRRSESISVLLLFIFQFFLIAHGFSGRQIQERLALRIPSTTSTPSSRLHPKILRQQERSLLILYNDISPSEEAVEADPSENLGVSEKTLVMKDMIQTVKSDDELIESEDVTSNHTTTTATEVEEVKVVDKVEEEESAALLSADDENSSSSPTEKISLSPKAVLRFIAPTLALWIAPPVMSLIDTSAVGLYCGPTDLAGTMMGLRYTAH